ncbi:MAG: serine protease, partial [Paracoccaceae bacterium]
LMPQETPAEARRGERALTRDDREEVQQALQWEGFYDGAIDAAFGPGTRSAMRSYQSAKGYDPTGILTTRQRAALLKSYREALADLGMQMVDNARAGIRIRLPMGMVEFARDDPPFVQYDSTTDHGVRVLLISQKGDQTTLFGLYDVMQTLEIVPMEGRRNRDSDSFVLTGRNATLHSYTYARLVNGTVKGFTLAWKPRDEDLMQRAVQIMRDTFDPYGNGALDETLGATTEDQNIDLMSGLEIRRPEISRSGFYVDGAGTVLTTSQVLEQCKRLTIGDDFEADVAARDDALGLAVLRPRQSLTPIAYAAFQTGAPRLQSDVSVAGFSYGDVLDLPVLTYGKLAQLKGLQGETDVSRLALDALPGDAGGPVFDRTGAVMGVLLPREDGNRKLPEDVSFAASIPAIAEFLSANAVKMAASDRTGAMDPEDLTKLAADMTVRVSCWN